MASFVSRMPLARCIALTLEPWRDAKADSVSPFFTTTRVLRGLAATVLDLVVVFVAAADDLGFELDVDTTDVLLGFVMFFAVVAGFDRATSVERVEVALVIGVMLLGGLSLAANKVASSASGDESFEKARLVHLEGLSAQAST